MTDKINRALSDYREQNWKNPAALVIHPDKYADMGEGDQIAVSSMGLKLCFSRDMDLEEVIVL